MKITSLNRSLAAVVILFFFILGAFAVSLAHEAPSEGVLHSTDFRTLLVNAHEELHGRRLELVWQFPPGDVPGLQATELYRSRVAGHRFTVLLIQTAPMETRVPKVSLQILQSILLI